MLARFHSGRQAGKTGQPSDTTSNPDTKES